MLVTIAAAASPLDRASGDLSAPRTADLPKRTRSWFRPAGGVADCPLDAPVILLKMARAGSSDIVQNLGKALPACRWDAELLHETNEFLSAGDYNKCNDAALAEEQRLFREAMGERSIISHNPVSTAGGCFSFAVERTGDGAMGGLPRLEELLEEHMPRRGVTVAWIRHNALRAAVSDHWMAVSGTVHSDGGTRSSTHYPKWGAPVRDIALATAERSANLKRVVSFEEYASDPVGTLGRLLTDLPYRDGQRPDVQGLRLTNASELLGTDGFRGAFVDPEAVYSELRSICLEWMMEGGSFSQLPERRQMCENEQYNCRDAVAGLVKFRHERVKTQIIERKPSNPLGGVRASTSQGS